MKKLFSCLLILIGWGIFAGDKHENIFALTEQTLDYVEKSKPLPQFHKRLLALKSDKKIDSVALEKKVGALRREIIFSHPDLDFDRLLINKRTYCPLGQRHMVDHYLGHNSIPADGLAVLDNWKTSPKEQLLLKGKMPVGDTRHPDLSFDGKKILFSFCVKKKDRFDQQFFIYEINVDGTGLRQITGAGNDKMEGKYGRKTQIIEDFDPCYLPDGGIVFVSTRLQGHVRCAFGARYCPTFCLYRMDYDGSNIRQLSYGDIAEYDPDVLPDGRVIYTRWEYIDRHDTWFQGLWTMKPDGTGTAHYYGNYTRSPCVVTEAKPIPGTKEIIALATAHHYFYVGSVIKVDPAKGEDDEAPLERLTPEVPFPETPGHRAGVGTYAMPYPINDEMYLVSKREKSTGHMAIFLKDKWGGEELIYRSKGTSCYAPIPIRPRKRPPAIPDLVDQSKKTGTYYIQNVYESRQNIPKGAVKFLRVIQIYDQAVDSAPRVGCVNGMTPYKILGEVPVNEDGSVLVEAPAGEPLMLQLLDENRMCIMGMRTFIYLQPGEVASCVGCHEQKRTTPTMGRTLTSSTLHSLTSPKSSDYAGGFSFMKSVQPVLDRHCISCHGLSGKSKMSLLGKLKMSPKRVRNQYIVSDSYSTLINYAKPAHRNAQTFFSVPKDYYSHASKLAPMLLNGHNNVKLSSNELHSIISWLDLNVPMYGAWSWNKDEFRNVDSEKEKQFRLFVRETYGENIASQPLCALVNIASPQKSRVLMAPLAKSAGGWGQVKPAWKSKKDPGYRKMKRLIREMIIPNSLKEKAGTCGLGSKNGCICGACWIRERYHLKK